MKKFLCLGMLFLILGSVTPASAQHCDVRKGDSMWRIAKRYNIEFHRILELNKHFKNPHMIHPKDEIELPDGTTGETTNQESGSDSIEEGNDETADRKESTQAQEVLKIVNQERSKQGLSALVLDDKLTSIANTKAADMRDKGYFDHNSPTYGSPFQMLQRFGVTYNSAGENIAAGQRTAASVMDSWMNSSGHRANILNKGYKKLGVGYVTGGSYGTYWVQLFTS